MKRLPWTTAWDELVIMEVVMLLYLYKKVHNNVRHTRTTNICVL
jgi:hypothetical protein